MKFTIDQNITQEKLENIIFNSLNITELDCRNCTNLVSIPQIVGLYSLECGNCPLLKSVPVVLDFKDQEE
jgi:hypothetical protein